MAGLEGRSPPEARREAKKRARRYGLRAEQLAVWLLIAKGYRILARQYVVPGGEIDLIAQRGETIAFVEVKARGDHDDALLAIDAAKRRRIGRATRAWLSRNPFAMRATLRGDAVLIAPLRLPKHVPNAFELRLD
jgi:putative endonuclease